MAGGCRLFLSAARLHRLRSLSCSLHTPVSSQPQPCAPVFYKAPAYGNRTALVDQLGHHSYQDLYLRSFALSKEITGILGNPRDDVPPERVSFLCPNDSTYVVCQWAAWMSGAIAVPLFKNHPPLELEYILKDSQSALVVSDTQYSDVIAPLVEKLGIANITVPDFSPQNTTEQMIHEAHHFDLDWKERGAMIVYTSGTTGRPKGVLSTHQNLSAMVRTNKKNQCVHKISMHHVR